MRSSQTGRAEFRPLPSRIGTGIYAAFALWWVLATLFGPKPASLLVLLPALLSIGAALYALFWRPAVVVDENAVELRNVVRDVRVPWPALDDVESRLALTLVVGERKFSSWAATGSKRPPIVVRSTDPGRLPGVDPAHLTAPAVRRPTGLPAAVLLVEEAWDAWQQRSSRDPGPAAGDPDGAEQPVLRWQPLPVLAAAVLALLAFAAHAAGA